MNNIFKKKNKNLPKLKWKDINLQQYLQIQDIIDKQDDLLQIEKTAMILSVIYNDNFLNKPIAEIHKYSSHIDFLKEEIPTGTVKDIYKVDGVRYKLCIDLSQITTAQYIDFMNFSKDNSVQNLPKIISVFLMPFDAPGYCDGYSLKNMEEVALHLPVEVCAIIWHYFFLYSLAFIKNTAFSLTNELKINNLTEKDKKMEKMLKILSKHLE